MVLRRLGRTARFALPALLVAGALFASEREARALGPIDLEAGLKVGVGTKPSAFAANPFGFGIGGRGGIGLFNFYLGVSGIYYVGSSTTSTTLGVERPYTPSSTLLGVEAGYSIRLLSLLTLRPQVGLGNWAVSANDTSANSLYLEPGVTALLQLGVIYVGADANVLFAPSVDQGDGTSNSATAFTFHAQVGIKL